MSRRTEGSTTGSLAPHRHHRWVDSSTTARGSFAQASQSSSDISSSPVGPRPPSLWAILSSFRTTFHTILRPSLCCKVQDARGLLSCASFSQIYIKDNVPWIYCSLFSVHLSQVFKKNPLFLFFLFWRRPAEVSGPGIRNLCTAPGIHTGSTAHRNAKHSTLKPESLYP